MDALPVLTAALGDRYTIDRQLGAGGMATVYLAHDTKHDRQVAIKVLRPDLAQILGGDRFLNEIHIAAQLRHPHILGLIDSGQAGQLLYYVMPFVEGESLRERLAREGALSPSDAVRILREVADALSAAHAKGIIHRDIKPENIMIEGRHALVMDFGVAKAVSAATDETRLTTAGLSLGTPAYMAPEQAAADPNVDFRADVYALGVVGYELLTGAPPFTGPPQQVLAAHVTQAPIPLTERRPDLPSDVAAVIMRCLEKRPKDRWPTAEALEQQLESLATPRQGTRATVAGRGARRSRWRLAAGLGVVGIAGALALWRLGGARPPKGSGDVIAVMPFAVRGNADLDYLGAGIATLLSTNLDGAGRLRSVNAHALLGYVGATDGAPTLDAARAVAQHFGAGLFIVGDLLDVGGRVRLTASLFDRRAEARALADATVEGAGNEVMRLVDQLAARLLAQQSVISGTILTSAATATTASLPALKTYLEGESAYRSGRYADAIASFAQATSADSTFALAFYRLSMAQERLARPLPEIRASAEAALRHAERLSDHDRRFLEAVVATRRGQAVEAEQQFRQLLRAYPDDAEAWYQLGELVFHRHPLLGGSILDAREPFSHALQYDQNNIGALYHLMRVVVRERDFVALDTLSRHYFSLSPTGDRNLELRGLQAYSLGDSAAIATIETDLASAPGARLFLAMWSIAVFAEDIEGAHRVAGLLGRPSNPDDVRSFGYLYASLLDAAMGRWRAAATALDRSRTLGGSDAPVVAPWLAALPFIPVSETEVRTARATLERWDADGYRAHPHTALTGVFPYIKTYVLGLLDVRLGELESGAALARTLDAAEGPPEHVRFAHELAQGVRAQVAVGRGEPAEALAILDSLRFENWYGVTFSSGFYSGALERFTKAELLRQTGRSEEALAWYDGLSQNALADLTFLGPAVLAQAEIAEALGDRTKARAAYDRFLRLWSQSDSLSHPLWRRARERRDHLVEGS